MLYYLVRDQFGNLKAMTSISPYTFVQETPSGAINGSNKNFTLSHKPISEQALILFMDGLVVSQQDYTINIETKTITLNTAPLAGQQLYAFYFYFYEH